MKKIAIVFCLGIMISCNKGPGEGGLASIEGNIWVEDYDQSFTDIWAEYDGADRDVYIIYGEDETYSDRVRTSPTGKFRFEGLRKGDYTIYTYSKDSSLQAPYGEIAIMVDVTINDKKQNVVVPQITVFE